MSTFYLPVAEAVWHVSAKWRRAEERSCHHKPVCSFHLCQRRCADIFTPKKLWIIIQRLEKETYRFTDVQKCPPPSFFYNSTLIPLKTKDALEQQTSPGSFVAHVECMPGLRWLTYALPLRLFRMLNSVPNIPNYKQTHMLEIPLSLKAARWPSFPLYSGYLYPLSPSGQR